jgi:hypothetical protein
VCEFDKANVVGLVLRIAHDVDCLRCQPPETYDLICNPFINFMSKQDVACLRDLVFRCTKMTGDRIRGLAAEKCDYDDNLFQSCSTNVNVCMERVDNAWSLWKKTQK